MSGLTGKKVLITGGTGTFGRAFLEKCLSEQAEEIRIFSRDEKKQFDMAQLYKNNESVSFYLGDIRDKGALDEPLNGIDYVFHAAAMKQVPSCEAFPLEALKTNINGSDNVINMAIKKRVKKVVFLSTDKAVYPTSAMGLSKAFMEKIALQKASFNHSTQVCITRFGNLVASRGSAVQLFIDQIDNGLPITITDPDMTRFIMTVDEAADLVEKAFIYGRNGEIFTKRTKACTTGDLAKAVCRYLNCPEGYPVEYIGSRPGEKMHEALLTEEEAGFAFSKGDCIIVPNKKGYVAPLFAEYRSDKAPRMTVEEIHELITKILNSETAIKGE